MPRVARYESAVTGHGRSAARVLHKEKPRRSGAKVWDERAQRVLELVPRDQFPPPAAGSCRLEIFFRLLPPRRKPRKDQQKDQQKPAAIAPPTRVKRGSRVPLLPPHPLRPGRVRGHLARG